MGLVLFVAFITPVLLALQQAQRMSASALPSFLRADGRRRRRAAGADHAREARPIPLLPIHLLRQPTIWRSDALAACHGATLVSLITFMPIYLRVLRGTSASETGLLLLPLMFGIGAGSMVTGRVVSRTGLTTIFPSVGLIVVTVCLVLLGLFAGNLGPRQLSLYLFVSGLFMGTVMGVVQVTVQNAAGAASLGSAAASVQLSRSIGAAVGTALVGTVLFATLSLSDPETARLFATLVQQGPDALAALPAGAPRHHPVGDRHGLPRRLPHHGRLRRHRPAARLVHPDAAAELIGLRPSRSPSQHHEMPRLRSPHRLERQPAIERHEPPAVLHGEAQQVDVGDLVGPEDMSRVEQGVISDRNVVRPELMARLVEPTTQCRRSLDWRAALQIARLRHDANKPVLR